MFIFLIISRELLKFGKKHHFFPINLIKGNFEIFKPINSFFQIQNSKNSASKIKKKKMATHHKTSSFSTDSSQNLQDFSKSLATIALFRSKSNQTSLYTEHNSNINNNNTNNSKGNAFLYNQAKNHRRTASNTLVTTGNRAHQRKLSTFSVISQGNRVESNDISREIGEISREIKKRQHNYEKITILLDKFQNYLQLGELNNENEKNESFQSYFEKKTEKSVKITPKICKNDLEINENGHILTKNQRNYQKQEIWDEEIKNHPIIIESRRESILQQSGEKASFSCCSDSICSIF